jgi:hypothetical protein
MSTIPSWLTPVTAIAFLAIIAAILWPWQALTENQDRGQPTDRHSERVYKNFEFFITVSLAIIGGIGYVRLEKFEKAGDVGRQAMIGLGSLELVVATAFSLFVIIHQGSKLRRWEGIEWWKSIFWLELWMCVAMMAVGSGIWAVAQKW